MNAHRVICAMILAALILISTGRPGFAQERVALVIGIGSYTNISPLPNPTNDAKLMAETLREIGFEVIEAIDINQIEMRRAIRDFGEAMERAGPEGIGLFFYAGHGVQVRGVNYLIPLGTRIERESDVPIEAVDASVILESMYFSPTQLNFVILDACRNNPFARGFRSAGRGLARMDAPSGTLIAYATAPGDVAADGDGVNSPYTQALATAMTDPELSVERMFREVRNEVMTKTNNRQVPWEASSLTGADFYFSPRAQEPEPSTAAVPGPAAQPGRPDMLVWNGIQNSENPIDYQVFIAQFPESELVPFAEARIQTLEEQQVALSTPAPTSRGDDLGRVAYGLELGKSFRHCPTCPEMMPIATGRFAMGSRLSEDGRDEAEGPRFQVTLRAPFAIGRYEVTRGQFAEFVDQTGYNYGYGCTIYDGRVRAWDEDHNWRDPAYEQTDDHPVVCVNWDDAVAYATWLSRTTGENYRLPTEAEWEYAARGGTETSRFWGDDPADACSYANVYDLTSAKKHGFAYPPHECEDGFAETAPVGSFAPNGYGLYDMIGNAREWTQDCWHPTYNGAPSNGTPWISGECQERVRRGGTWHHPVSYARSAYRGKTGPKGRVFLIGFRVVWEPLN